MDADSFDQPLRWRMHGAYEVKGIDRPLDIGWWSREGRFADDSFDIQTSDGTVSRLWRDYIHKTWHIDAVYDSSPVKNPHHVLGRYPYRARNRLSAIGLKNTHEIERAVSCMKIRIGPTEIHTCASSLLDTTAKSLTFPGQ